MIIHLDMDAFFASVEQLDNPELRGRPVIVGGQNRGVVATASYEARRYGIHSAMPMVQARKLCPHGVFLRGRYHRYAEISRIIMKTLEDFSPQVEQASIDEAYLDGTGMQRLFGKPEAMLSTIRQRVREESGGLSCSLGMAPVRFLAKICSEINKPAGFYILPASGVKAFLRALPVARLPGVGKSMQQTLQRLGIATVGQLAAYSVNFLEERFGKIGKTLHERAHGRDARGVCPGRPGKSESSESTLAADTRDKTVLARLLLTHAEKLGESLRKKGLQGRTITLKLKYSDFSLSTHSRTLVGTTDCTDTIFRVGNELLEQTEISLAVRLVGLAISGFGHRASRLSLPLLRSSDLETPFSDKVGREERQRRLDFAIDALRERFGSGSVMRGRLFVSK